MTAERVAWWLTVTVGISVWALQAVWIQPWTVDDAYITFRYADNVLAGHGPVFNPGEWVEGYTSPVWLALLVVAGSLGVSPPLAAKVLGGVAGLVTMAATAWMPRVHGSATAAAVAFLGTGGMLAAWSFAGLETALASALGLAVGIAGLRRRPAWVGGLGAVATLTRPESLLVVVVFAAGRRWRTVFLWFATCFVPIWALRWAIYGWPLPNTFYAKVGASPAQVWRGLEYLGEFAVAGAGLWVGWAALALLHRRLDLSGRDLVVRIGVLVGLHLAWVAFVGGDALPAFRFLVPVLPWLAVGAGIGLWLVATELGDRAWMVAVGLALLLHIPGTQHPELTRRIDNGNVGRNGVEVGTFLRHSFPPDTLVATNTAGSVPWASQLPTIDMLGLTDAHIAHRQMPRMGRGAAGHEKADGAYVLSRNPDLVIFGAARGKQRPVFESDRQLARRPEFKSGYVFERYRLPSGALLSVYRRREFTPWMRPRPLGPPR